MTHVASIPQSSEHLGYIVRSIYDLVDDVSGGDIGEITCVSASDRKVTVVKCFCTRFHVPTKGDRGVAGMYRHAKVGE